MAAREAQGLQIALIIFVALTLVLIVTTYYFFSSSQTAQERVKALTTENGQKDQAARTAQDESGRVKGLLDPKLDNIKTAEEAAAKDFEAHGKGLAEADQNYRGLMNSLVAQLTAANTRITEITAHEKEMADKMAADEATKKKEIDEYTQTIAKTSKDLEDERKKFTEFREAMSGEKGDLVAKFDETRKRFDELTKTSSEEIAALKAENAKLDGLIKNIHSRDEELQKANEVADGRIQWVNQRERTVYINVGGEDGLRRQTTFSVFSSEASNPRDSERKGKVEVIHLKGPHMAEARIVEDDLANPLMPGDQIFSPTWQPGRPEHFALAGDMDIDGDRVPDVQRIRDLIAMNGGVIDAEVGDDGRKVGQMSINTKYLVLGDQPKAVEGSNTLAAWTDLRGEAQTLGVKTINIKEFLNYMGYKEEDRTVQLGKEARSEDFKVRLPEGVQRIRPGTDRLKDLRRPLPTSKP